MADDTEMMNIDKEVSDAAMGMQAEGSTEEAVVKK